MVQDSDEAELFVLTPAIKGGLSLTITNSTTGQLPYKRHLSSKETLQVTLTGFGGADFFERGEKVETSINIIIAGSGGADTYPLKGTTNKSVRCCFG